MTIQKQLTNQNKRLLNLLQSDFPLVIEPFKALGQELGISEEHTLEEVRSLKEEGIIRYIGAIFDSRRLGYHSALVAMRIAPEQLDTAASVISRHHGVSHNYAREYDYNLWFILTLPPNQDLAATVESLTLITGVKKVIILPALRVFKVDARFDMLGEDKKPRTQNQGDELENWVAEAKVEQLSSLEIAIIRELQGDLLLKEKPFTPMSGRLKIDVTELLGVARDFLACGAMRRYGAVINHRRAGFTANAMGCWIVPPPRVEEVGKSMSSFPVVTHCYERLTCADWPYNLFTMIHGRTREECETIAREMSHQTGVADYILLYSTREYKKERIQYFA